MKDDPILDGKTTKIMTDGGHLFKKSRRTLRDGEKDGVCRIDEKRNTQVFS